MINPLAQLTDFQLLRPLWLLGLLPAAVFLALLRHRLGRNRGWHSVISPTLLPHLLVGRDRDGGSSGKLLYGVGLAWLLAVFALAGPSWEQLPQPVQRKQDALIILYDLSYSMLSEDIKPSRLIRSRQKLLDLLQQRREGSTALIAYAGDAHVVSPLTDDVRTLANLLPALDPNIMPVPGSAPQRAVALALQLFADAGFEQGHLLLISDGITGAAQQRIQEQLQRQPWRLSIIGIGTPTGGPIPRADGFLKDSAGTIVIAGLEEAPLRALAAALGGSYSRLSLDERDLAVALAAAAADARTEAVAGRSVDRWQDAGYWLVLLLLPLLLATFRRGWLLALALLLPGTEPAVALEWVDLWQTPDQQAGELLQSGAAAAAAQRFRNPDWAAAAHYRAGDYASALAHYRQGERADDWYNRGNALARQGQWQQALSAYERALQLQPDMGDARFNQQLLEQLLQQQEQQQGEQQQGEQQQGEQQQGEQQGRQQQGEQPQGGRQRGQEQQGQQQGERQQGRQDADGAPQQAARDGAVAPPEDASTVAEGAENGTAENTEKAAAASNDEATDETADKAADEALLIAEQERRLAYEQWLRRIPDDPGGLLRRKFEYESRQRRGDGKDANEPDW